MVDITAEKLLNNSVGFTLVELLVVISIIAILSLVGLIGFTNLNKGGRDAKRQSDLRVIQSALQQYYADQSYYPTALAMQTVLNGSSALTNDVGARAGTILSKTYRMELPKDPVTGARYCYESLPDGCDNSLSAPCASYYLYAKLENTRAGNTYNCSGGSNYNLRVTPP